MASGSQRSIAKRLSDLGLLDSELAKLTPAQLKALRYCWEFIARPQQLEPEGDWDILLWMAGRGFGKSRSLAEWLRMRVKLGARRIGIIARTVGDVRDVLVEGPSGILSVFPPQQRPIYEPSKRRVTFHTGAVATTYTADAPDQLRGPEHDTVIADEIAAWQDWDTWSNMIFGLRGLVPGLRPRVAAATTPRAKPHIKALRQQPNVRVIQGSTYANAANLPESFLQAIEERYGGTTLGRQEILAELLDETPGALWQYSLLDEYRLSEAPDSMSKVVIGVDPSVSIDGNECGIIVCGRSPDKHCYVLADRSVRGSPLTWSNAVAKAHEDFNASYVVAEANQGGALVEANIKASNPDIKVKLVHASRGKEARAEPVVSKYEQGLVHHIGKFQVLEDQLAGWVPGEGESPDRLDALVYALTDIALTKPALLVY